MRTGLRLSITTIFLAMSLQMQAAKAHCAAPQGCPESNEIVVAAAIAGPLVGGNSCFAPSAVDQALEHVLCEEDFGIGECSLLKQVSREFAGPFSVAEIDEDESAEAADSSDNDSAEDIEEGC